MVGIVRFALAQGAILFAAVVAVSGLPRVGPDGRMPALAPRPFAAEGGSFRAPARSIVVDPLRTGGSERLDVPPGSRRAWIRHPDGSAAALLVAADSAALDDARARRVRERALAGVRERSVADVAARDGLVFEVVSGRDPEGRWRMVAEGTSRRGVRVLLCAAGEREEDREHFALPLLRSVRAPDVP